jgi:hypothetical protein
LDAVIASGLCWKVVLWKDMKMYASRTLTALKIGFPGLELEEGILEGLSISGDRGIWIVLCGVCGEQKGTIQAFSRISFRKYVKYVLHMKITKDTSAYACERCYREYRLRGGKGETVFFGGRVLRRYLRR